MPPRNSGGGPRKRGPGGPRKGGPGGSGRGGRQGAPGGPRKHTPRQIRPAPSVLSASIDLQRVFEVPAKAVYSALNDASRRNWAPEPGYRVVSALAPRFVRVDLPSGGQLAFSIERQGNTRCSVSLEFSSVADVTKATAQWRDGLGALAEQLDFDWD